MIDLGSRQKNSNFINVPDLTYLLSSRIVSVFQEMGFGFGNRAIICLWYKLGAHGGLVSCLSIYCMTPTRFSNYFTGNEAN